MKLRFWQNRKTRLAIIAVVALATVAVLSTVRQPRQPRQPRKPQPPPVSTRPTSASLADLVREADEDLRRGQAGAAVNKYRLALEIKSKSPNLKSKLRQAEERLPDEAPKRVDAGDTTSADTGPFIWRPADLGDPKSTPAGILPPEMEGYKITQNGWLKEPTLAGATYVPLSPSVAKQIDRVFLTVGKFAGPGEAKQLLEREYEMFPVNQQKNQVNDHSATFGLYNEARPDVFPILASLSWTREDWFFSVQAAPLINRENRSQPSETFKRAILMDVAEKLGY